MLSEGNEIKASSLMICQVNVALALRIFCCIDVLYSVVGVSIVDEGRW